MYPSEIIATFSRGSGMGMVMKNSAQNVDKTSDNNFGVTIMEEYYPVGQLNSNDCSMKR